MEADRAASNQTATLAGMLTAIPTRLSFVHGIRALRRNHRLTRRFTRRRKAVYETVLGERVASNRNGRESHSVKRKVSAPGDRQEVGGESLLR